MKFTGLSLIVLSVMFLAPLTASAETSTTTDCKNARGEIKQARSVHGSFELQREKTKKRVRHIYQELFICHSNDLRNSDQLLHCQQLAKEAPIQFQSMIQLVTASHEASRELKALDKQVQKLCSSPSTPTALTRISQLAIR